MSKFFGKRNTAAIAALVVAAVAGVGAYAFTAQNSVPPEIAGAGTATVGAFTVSNVSYTFSADTTTVDAISFELDHPANDVAVDLEASGATPAAANYKDCGPATGTGPTYTVSCTGLSFANDNLAHDLTNDLYVAAVTSGSVSLD